MSYNNLGTSEYGSILSGELSTDALVEFCIGGGLRTSRLRSIVWRIHLGCLPLSKHEWISSSQQSRMLYFELKRKHILDPRAESCSQDDPLCINETSPWKKYFDDHNLRDLINKDVIRTFPEIQYFQEHRVRTSLAAILLTYAKENPTISYKQGMHEILAPLLFVLYSDQQSFQHAKDQGELNLAGAEDMEALEAVYDERFLENDAYTMFCEMMADIGTWFLDGENELPSAVRKLGDPVPFRRAQDNVANSPVMRELAVIDIRFYKEDPALASYLRGLDITSQLYGLRWLRVLFGREFPIHDSLYLWDVILADRPIPRIAECFFVAMLVQIRELLINSDYSTCMQYLMRYPPTVDINYLIQLVRHYRKPWKHQKPRAPALPNFAGLTISGATHPNRQTGRPRQVVAGFEEPPSGFRMKSHSMLTKVKTNLGEISGISQILTSPRSSPQKKLRGVYHSPSPQKMQKLYASPQKDVVRMEDDLTKIEHQVSILQGRLNNLDFICGDIAHQLEIAAEDVLGAETEEARQEIAADLKKLKNRLITEANKELPPIVLPRIDPAVEAQSRPAVSVPRVQNENEMVEFKTPRQ